MSISKKIKRIILIILLFLCTVWFVDFQTHAVKLRKISLASHVPVIGGPIRLIQISDLHYKGNRRTLVRAISKINSLKPDVVFITGDLVESENHLQDVLAILSQIKSANGVYAVAGNWEYWSGILPEKQVWFKKTLLASGIVFLKNEGARLSIRGNEISVYGLDSWFARNEQALPAFTPADEHVYKICLAHEPLLFERWTTGYNIMLSGHAHGGQVVLPLLGPLWLPDGCGGYCCAFHSIRPPVTIQGGHSPLNKISTVKI